MEITYADVSWLAHGWELGDVWCLTFVRGIEETEALRRLGAAEESIRPLSYQELTDEGLFPHTVLAGRLHGWVVLIERNGSEGTKPDAIRALSAGTELVSVTRHDYATDLFVYAIDGDRLTSFDPRKPAWRYGSDPDRLLDAMREVGVDPTYLPGGHVTGQEAISSGTPTMGEALMLAARLTGVVLTQEVLNGPLVGGAVHSPADDTLEECAERPGTTSHTTANLFGAIRRDDPQG
ncbi:DUF6461 domain-containing protein [Nonomuraea basaltis]|uniref:DUF6461 domain-containing protein n=1 Tax=Nonomuraea basaltis TaxID=2495887 RepID=UPI00110C5EAE|nr:DUF6461 domain-containing protein [Nonomuraea basaltis]TMR94717.1 hypothetical protein EJK15_32355 [Nonomuraea basaltis]